MPRVIRAKLHGIRVTMADLHYHGSITLDPEHCEAAGLYPTEFVDIWNKNSGARLSTYIILGEPGSRCCVLNGAAARTCQVGDELIIAASDERTPAQLYDHKPKVVTFTPNNEIDEILAYDVFKSEAREFDFRIIDVKGKRAQTVQSDAVRNYPYVDMRAIRGDLKAKGLGDAAIEDFVARFLTR